MAEVAIVILNYNGRSFLEKFLPSVIEHSHGHEIIIADNASTDTSVPFLNEEYSHLRLIQTPTNLGYAGGYNYALNLIEAKYYVLLNSDVEVTPNWVNSIIPVMEADSTIVAAQPKILSYHQKDHFEYAGAGGGYIDYLGYPFCRGRLFDSLEKDEGQYDDQIQVFWASGACLFIRSNVYHEQGGLDEDFFAHMEEIDLCWRINHSGYKIMYCPESTIYHVGGGTLSKSSPRKTYLNFRNGLSLLYKNYSTSQLFTLLPIRVILDLVASLQFLMTGKPKDAWTVLKAIGHFMLRYRKNKSKRKETQLLKSKKIGERLIYAKSVVFQYFLKGRKKYSELSN